MIINENNQVPYDGATFKWSASQSTFYLYQKQDAREAMRVVFFGIYKTYLYA